MLIDIPGAPFAQPRQRVTTSRRRDGRTVARTYQPAEARSWKERASWAMLRARGEPIGPSGRVRLTAGVLSGPLRIGVVFWFACPKTAERRRAPAPAQWHQGRPDLDNLLKAVLDAGTGVLWGDDRQVVAIWPALKLTAAQGAPARTVVTVEPAAPLGTSGALGGHVEAWALAGLPPGAGLSPAQSSARPTAVRSPARTRPR